MKCNGTFDTDKEPLAVCDNCNTGLCQQCSKLTATELRAVTLKKRIITYWCADCRPALASNANSTLNSPSPVDLRNEISKTVEVLLKSHSDEISNKLEMFVKNIKESNVELVKFLTEQPHLISNKNQANVNSLMDDSYKKSNTISPIDLKPQLDTRKRV